MAKVTVNKLQAARRQLETALDLYFNEKDPVSIHTLTAAAYNVLRDVNLNTGGTPMLVKQIHAEQIATITGKKLGEIRSILNETENFFKHAKDDPTGMLTFDDGQAEVLLFDAIGKYIEITQERVPVFGAFHLWFASRHPDNLKPGFVDKAPPPELVEAARRMTRRQWLDWMLASLGPDGHTVYRDGGWLVKP
jgi:hypothetical protein